MGLNAKETRFHQGKTLVGAEGPGPNPKCDLQALTNIGQEKQEQISKQGRGKGWFFSRAPDVFIAA